jgi:predicted dehydrogenase
MARDFAAGLRYAEGAELAAIGSRSADKATRFADLSGALRAHGSYQALVSDPGVDVVYVATPHAMHKDHSLLVLEAGKALVCEKPFAMNAQEADAVIAVAHRRELFCMEAMWMHFLPGMRKAMELISAGAIGEPRMLTADFGYPTRADPRGRSFDPALGGGALLDRGVYPLALAWRLFGKPDKVNAMATFAATGVDAQSSATIKYPGGQIAVLSATLTGYASNEAVIIGSEGRITIHEPFCRADRLTVSRTRMLTDEELPMAKPRLRDRLRSSRLARGLRRLLPEGRNTVHVPYVGNGFNYEAAEVMRCLAEGLTESPVWPLDQTAGVMQTMDLVRARWAA